MNNSNKFDNKINISNHNSNSINKSGLRIWQYNFGNKKEKQELTLLDADFHSINIVIASEFHRTAVRSATVIKPVEGNLSSTICVNSILQGCLLITYASLTYVDLTTLCGE